MLKMVANSEFAGCYNGGGNSRLGSKKLYGWCQWQHLVLLESKSEARFQPFFLIQKSNSFIQIMGNLQILITLDGLLERQITSLVFTNWPQG
jgi:hypothetical protein